MKVRNWKLNLENELKLMQDSFNIFLYQIEDSFFLVLILV